MILVTGATGFLGQHLLLHLLNTVTSNENVVALYRTDNSKLRVLSFFALFGKSELYQNIIWKQADILNISSLETVFQDITIVYHCAALVSFDPSDEVRLRKINIEGTANVVNLCLDFGLKKLCYVSSIAALGDLLPHETTISEKSEWKPELNHSDYSISKFGAEMEVWRAQQEGLNVIIVNPGVILGVTTANEWSAGSCKIFKTIANGLQFYTNGSTGFVGVSDVVKIMILLMDSEIVNKKFILIAENWTYEKLTFEIAKNLNLSQPKFLLKNWQTNILWFFDWVLGNIFFQKRKLSKSMANSLHSQDFYDNAKIKKTLGFEFEPLKNTIQKTAKYYLAKDF
ncbi:MAG: hypothetical protein RLZZ312_977 [Bacteroidota bacterium]